MNRQIRRRSLLYPPVQRRQRGTMLIIALIVLVAMTLAGIATMRSVDTASMVAGNIGFRQSTLNAADQGLQAAYTWLTATAIAGSTTLYNDNNSSANSVGYFASVPTTGDPDWTQSGTWLNAALLNGGVPDSAGNIVAYRVDRMCSCAGSPTATCPNGIAQSCGSTPTTPGSAGPCEGCDQSQPNFFTLPPAIHYRITARSVGPRAAVAFVQVMLRAQ